MMHMHFNNLLPVFGLLDCEVLFGLRSRVSFLMKRSNSAYPADNAKFISGNAGHNNVDIVYRAPSTTIRQKWSE